VSLGEDDAREIGSASHAQQTDAPSAKRALRATRWEERGGALVPLAGPTRQIRRHPGVGRRSR
jgi:hypothetical protein